MRRPRVALIFSVVALVIGGAALFFVTVHVPGRKLAAARAELAAWETRWQTARTCLTGPTPGAERLVEAIAIRELSPEPWDPALCARLIATLTRDADAADTEHAAIEEAWLAVDTAAGKVAIDFAKHIDTAAAALPEALDQLEVARDAVRAAAGLPATPAQGTPLEAAEVIPLVVEGEPVRTLEGFEPAGAGVVASGTTKSYQLRATLVAGQLPVLARVAPDGRRAMVDDSRRAGELGRVAIALDSGVLAFETRAGVMKIHRRGAPRYLAVPDGFEPRAATASATQVDVIGHVHGIVAIIRFPI